MMQKRCYRGEFRLRPNSQVNQAIEYSLAYTANHFGVDLHEFVGMSSHLHLEFTDRFGNRPLFIQAFHSLVARAINCLYKEGDSLFSGQRYSAPVLLEGEDVYKRMLYILLNPVEAGVVRNPKEWEGANSFDLEYGRPKVIKKPDFFFSDKMPDEVELEIIRPPQVKPELSDKELRKQLRYEAKEESYAIIKRLKAEGGRVLGMKRASKIPRRHTVRDRMSPGGQRSLESISPHVACKNRKKRIRYLTQLKEFWAEHRQAFVKWQGGEKEIVFPHRTYKMRAIHGAACEPPSPE